MAGFVLGLLILASVVFVGSRLTPYLDHNTMVSVMQRMSQENEGVHANAQMSTKQLQVFCKLNSESQQLLKMAMTKLNLSARAYDRILKVARTIADLEKNKSITSEHIAEAIQYRSLDREGWAG